MDKDKIKDIVKGEYRQAALQVRSGGRSCCGTTTQENKLDAITNHLYSDEGTRDIPPEAVLASFGCGNPTALAELHPGETVLDLGSGGGIDVLLSGKRVDPRRHGSSHRNGYRSPLVLCPSKRGLTDQLFLMYNARVTSTSIKSVAKVMSICHALSDETRVRLIERLGEGEQCVCDLTDSFKTGQSRLSFHLKVLKDAGLVIDRREGRWVYYSLNRAGIEELEDLVKSLKSTASSLVKRGSCP